MNHIALVEQFHVAFQYKQPTPRTPDLTCQATNNLREDLIREELCELEESLSVRDPVGVLDALCDIAGVHPDIEVDPARYRPTDCLPTLDTTRIRREIGWFPEIPLATTLRDIYEHMLNTCRNE